MEWSYNGFTIIFMYFFLLKNIQHRSLFGRMRKKNIYNIAPFDSISTSLHFISNHLRDRQWMLVGWLDHHYFEGILK